MAVAVPFWRNCRKVVCIGRNYADHAAELGNARPSRPFFFLKPPSCMLLASVGSRTADMPQQQQPSILVPDGVDAHHEVELALVMGAELRHRPGGLSMEESLASIRGYAVAIDVTARNVQAKAKEKALPWTAAKGFDTFLPISNLIPKSRIPDPHNVQLRLSVDGHDRQRGSTADMIFRIPALLSEITSVMHLEPDDVVLTGTPQGVGSLRPGQRVSAGCSVNGRDLLEARLELGVRASEVPYRL